MSPGSDVSYLRLDTAPILGAVAADRVLDEYEVRTGEALEDVARGTRPGDRDRRRLLTPQEGRHVRVRRNRSHQVLVRDCLNTILSEEWSHRLYAERDLDVLASREGSRR